MQVYPDLSSEQETVVGGEIVGSSPTTCTTLTICGYDRHVNICHKKAVADFSDNALVKEINSIDNLVALCPTHHWEYDNGFINIL